MTELGESESTESDDLIDVLRGGLMSVPLRIGVLWLVSSGGSLSVQLITDYRVADEEFFWFNGLTVPLSFVTNIIVGLGEFGWISVAPLLFGLGLWLRCFIRMCRGRWIFASLCQAFFASFLLALAHANTNAEKGWLIGLMTAIAVIGMILCYYLSGWFRRARAAEAEYEQDGL